MRRSRLKSLGAVVLAALSLILGQRVPVRAAEQVDLLLVLAADISRSVDAVKFKLQRDGYASAITDPRVMKAIQSGASGKIAISFVEWSGPAAQAVMVDWTLVSNPAEAQALAQRIRDAPRQFMERTAIGSAIDFSVRLIETAPYEATRHVIDVSGDGTSNAGRNVVDARQDALDRGITINGIVILSAIPLPNNPSHTHPPGGLKAYYENNVAGGPGSFVLEAESFQAFGTAIASKLVKEIAALPVSLADQRRLRVR